MFKTAISIAALALALGAGAGCNKKEKLGDSAPKVTADDRAAENRAAEKKVAADNTAMNDRDRPTTTAQNAGMGTSDVDIMASIRKRVVDDGSLSTNAHNVKIVAKDGIVTLIGPVGSAAERDAIATIAIDVVGAKNVVNQIEIAP